MSSDRTKIHVNFHVPLVNRTLKAMDSDPFDIMSRTKLNKTCRIKYIGSESVIVDKLSKCVYPLYGPYRNSELFLIPKGQCQTRQIYPNISKDYAVEHCVANQINDHRQFFKVKYAHGLNYVYCPYSSINVSGKIEKCPDHEVLIIPANVGFSVDGRNYQASNVQLEHRQEGDPLISFHINWHLQPTLHVNQIMADINRAEQHIWNASKITISDESINTYQPTKSILGLISLIIFISLLIVTVVCVNRFKKKTEMRIGRVRVRAKRVKFVKVPETIEEIPEKSEM